MPIGGIGLRLCARRISRPLWQNGSWKPPGIAPNPAFQPIGDSYPRMRAWNLHFAGEFHAYHR